MSKPNLAFPWISKSVFRLAVAASLSLGNVVAQPPEMSWRGGDRGDRGGDEGGRGRMSMMFSGGGVSGPSGFSGGFGGPPMGGFDPGAMLARFDRNGNKMLDPDEMQGPAGFFLQRMAQSNPKIDLSKPVPLEVISGEFERLRQERMGGGGWSGGWGGGSWGGGEAQPTTENSGPKPLVPTFGLPELPKSVPGFGSSGNSGEPTVTVIDRDIKEAEDRLNRYDGNRDGKLSRDELSSGRWSDDPMQYDRNGDGNLTKEELAVRYAKRRIAEEQQQQGSQGPGSGGGGDFRGRSMMFMGGGGFSGGPPGGGFEGGGYSRDGRGGGERGAEATGNPEEKPRAKSLRQLTTKEKIDKLAGKPDWFTRDDKDGDGQVSLNEFASNFDDKVIAEFQQFDLNTDGFITTVELLKAVNNGANRGSSGSSGRSGASFASGRSDARKEETPALNGSAGSVAATEMAAAPSGEAAANSGGSQAAASATSAPATASAGAKAPLSEADLKWGQKQLSKYDKNSDGVLTPNEWTTMPIPPKDGTDANGDGRIDVDEYTRFRTNK